MKSLKMSSCLVVAAIVAVSCGTAEPPAQEQLATPGSEVETGARSAPPASPATSGSTAGSPVSTPAAEPATDPAPPVRDRPAPPPAAEPAPPAEPAAQDEGARILRGAAAAYEKIRAMQADFTMHVDNPLLRSKTTSRGTLYQRRPDRILLQFSEPAGDVIVGDGTHFWIYYPSTDPQQVFRAPAAQAGAGGVDLQAQFVGDPAERFTYTLHGQENVGGRQTHVLTMRPRGDAGYETLKVWVDARDSLVRRFEITEHNAAVRRFDLANLQTNPVLSDALFRFTPPSGVRVVERN